MAREIPFGTNAQSGNNRSARQATKSGRTGAVDFGTLRPRAFSLHHQRASARKPQYCSPHSKNAWRIHMSRPKGTRKKYSERLTTAEKKKIVALTRAGDLKQIEIAREFGIRAETVR